MERNSQLGSMLLSLPGYILAKVNSLMPVSHNSQLMAILVGGVAQWLGCRSVAGGLSLICA